jgi:hypothetical protein
MDTADSALARWRAAGYSTADVASFLTAARATLDHSNVVLPLRVRTAIMHVRAVRTAALRLLNATAATPWGLQPAASSSSGAGVSGFGGTSSTTGGSNGRRAVLQAGPDNAAAAQQQQLLEQGVLTELMATMAELYGYGPTGAVEINSAGAVNGSSGAVAADVPTRLQMMQEYRRSLGLPYTPVCVSTFFLGLGPGCIHLFYRVEANEKHHGTCPFCPSYAADNHTRRGTERWRWWQQPAGWRCRGRSGGRCAGGGAGGHCGIPGYAESGPEARPLACGGAARRLA